MGEIIHTGVGRSGHTTEFIYEGNGESKRCILDCKCGWRVEIKAFRNYGGVIESRIRYDEHLESIGLKRLHPLPIRLGVRQLELNENKETN